MPNSASRSHGRNVGGFLPPHAQGRDDRLVEILSGVRVLPVLTIDDLGVAVPLVRSLVAAGLSAVEITLRTDQALAAISLVVNEVEEAVLGAGTVTHPEQLFAAAEAGAAFAVSPGLTDRLREGVSHSKIPLLPGVATASEAMEAAEAGFEVLKLFPATALGGVALLDALRATLPFLRFCPTGGLNRNNFQQFLSCPNVLCVGGSWMVAPEDVAAGQWDEATRRALEMTT